MQDISKYILFNTLPLVFYVSNDEHTSLVAAYIGL